MTAIFSIFDQKNDSTLKKFLNFLRSQNIYCLTDTDVGEWIGKLEPYKDFRNKVIAHSALDRPFTQIDYQVFLNMLEEFEHKLNYIRNNYITHHSVLNGVRPLSTVDLAIPILVELRQLLSYNPAFFERS